MKKSIYLHTMATVLALLMCVCLGWGLEWSEDIQITSNQSPEDSLSNCGNNVMVRDNYNNFHILLSRNLNQEGVPDSLELFYIRLDSCGNTLSYRNISPCKIRVTSLHGLLDSAGNVHFFWYQHRTRMFSGMYCRFSPEGEILDGPRALTGGTYDSFLDSENRIWLFTKNRTDNEDIFDNDILYHISNEGELLDTVVVFNRPWSNTTVVAIAPNDVVYHFYDIITHRYPTMWCTAFDLNGNIIHDNVSLDDTSQVNLLTGATTCGISPDSTIYLACLYNSRFWIRGMNLELDLLFSEEMSNTTQVSDLGEEIGNDGNCHIVWEGDTYDDGIPQRYRYHVTYGIINRDGEFLGEPEWISESNWKSGYFALLPLSNDSRALTFFRQTNPNYPHNLECFFKHYPSLEDHVKPKETNKINGTDAGFDIFPNPTNGHIKIQFPNFNVKNYSISIYDLSARLLFAVDDNTTSESFSLPSTLQSGLYFVQLRSGTDVETRKMVLVR